jgi:hypothetical protein
VIDYINAARNSETVRTEKSFSHGTVIGDLGK